MIADIWFWTPFAVILMVAGFQSLPTEPFEAATVDGASPWQQFWYIALPLLTPVLITVVLLRAMDAFKIFDIVYILTYGGPGLTTEMINTYGYKVAFRHFRMGMSSAIAIIGLIVMVLMAMGILTSFRKRN